MAQNIDMPPPSYSVDDVYSMLLSHRFEQKVAREYMVKLENKIKNRERLLSDTLVARNSVRIRSMCHRGIIDLIVIITFFIFKKNPV